MIILPTISDYGNVHASTAGEEILDGLLTVLSLFVGLGTIGIRLVAAGLGVGVSAIVSAVAGLGSELSGDYSVTPVAIFFNKVAILDINFFDFNPPNMGADSMIVTFRTTIATWYYIIRALATAILLVVLIYVGIRMAISTIASEKAMYKKMLVDWVASVALIYLLHYFIIFIISINQILVDVIATTASDLFEQNGFNDFQNQIMLMSVSPFNGFVGIVCTILFLYIIFQTIKFLFIYIKRMMTVGFLIIIAPLITLTYSMDKMGDGKAQALGTWLKEFCYNVLIQPFHCILYLVFVYAAMALMTSVSLESIPIFPTSGTETLGAGILAIMCINFIDKGEDIIRKIFGFQNASSLASSVVAAGVVSNMASKASSLGKSGAKMVNSAKKANALMNKTFKNTGNRLNNINKRLNDKRLTNKATRIANKEGTVIKDGTGEDAKAITDTDQKIAAIKERLQKGTDIRTGGETEKSRARDQKQKDKAQKQQDRKEKFDKKQKQRQERKDARKQPKVDEIAEKMVREEHPEIKDENQIKEMAKSQEYQDKANKRYEATRPKQRIKGAASKTSTFMKNHGITYQNAKGFVKSNLPGAMALVGFTANFAGTGKVVTSLIAGGASYEGTQEFLKNSKGTLRGKVDDNVQVIANATGQDMDQDTKANHIATTNMIGQNGGYDPKNIQSFANDMINYFQSIAATLHDKKTGQKANITSMDSSQLANQTNALMHQGYGRDEAFEMAFKNSKFANTDINQEQKDNLKNKTMEYVVFNANASIYNQTQTAVQAGMDPTDLASRTTITAVGGGTVVETRTTVENSEEVDQRSLDQAHDTIDNAKNESDKAVADAEAEMKASEGGSNPVHTKNPPNNGDGRQPQQSDPKVNTTFGDGRQPPKGDTPSPKPND
jgi:hypothetical protein